MPARRLFLPTLLIASAALTGCADRAQETTAPKTNPADGVWDVVSIDEQDCGTWHGNGPDGEDVGGCLWIYTATCRDGDRTRKFTLTDELLHRIHAAELPLQTGDRFQLIQNPNTVKDAETVSLPDGVTVKKVATKRSPMQSDEQ
jgi:hypothetical protein